MSNCGTETRKKERNLGKVILESRGYNCLELLGQGAFSTVYCVCSRTDSHLYACKISENMLLLKREAEIMSMLRHPLFPEYVAFWQEAGLGFLLREYIAGICLEELLRQERCFSVEQTICTGLELAAGLLYLHEQPECYLFRDMKPANVIICREGRVKLIDLGCICSSKERITSRAGTKGFAAPEQLRREKETGRERRLTTACDVYGLGQTLRAMLGPEKRFLAGGRRRNRKRLEKILDACTKEEASERISGMRDVTAVLRALK